MCDMTHSCVTYIYPPHSSSPLHAQTPLSPAHMPPSPAPPPRCARANHGPTKESHRNGVMSQRSSAHVTNMESCRKQTSNVANKRVMSQRSEVAMESCRNGAMLRAGVTSRSHVANKRVISQQSHVTKKSCRNGATSHARVTSKSHVANRRVASRRSHVANTKESCRYSVMSQTEQSCHKNKGVMSQRSHVATGSCRKRSDSFTCLNDMNGMPQ